MTILVTGGAGFIGSHLCEARLQREHKVVALDSFDDFYEPTVKRTNLAKCDGAADFRLVEGDIRDADTVDKVLDEHGVEVIVHLAARAGVRPSIEQPVPYQDVNVGGTTVLLEAARLHGVRKFIFASSSSVYGNSQKTPFAEDHDVDRPISPYAATKRAGELLCHTYHHLYDINITCLRFFTTYGPRQRPDLAIHKFARLIEAGDPVPVFGDGTMMRDFTYVDDIVDGVRRAIERCRGYHIYNLGESQPVGSDGQGGQNDSRTPVGDHQRGGSERNQCRGRVHEQQDPAHQGPRLRLPQPCALPPCNPVPPGRPEPLSNSFNPHGILKPRFKYAFVGGCP